MFSLSLVQMNGHVFLPLRCEIAVVFGRSAQVNVLSKPPFPPGAARAVSFTHGVPVSNRSDPLVCSDGKRGRKLPQMDAPKWS